VPSALLEPVKSLGRQEGATLFMTLLAAFQVLLHRYTGQDDVAVGSPVAGRTGGAELEDLIGLFVNSLVIRVDLSGDPSFRTLLRRVRETAIEAYAHQDVPFEQLVSELHPDRGTPLTPLFQVFFALQNQPLPPLRSPEIEFTPIETAGGSAKFEVSLFAIETQEGLFVTIEYDADLFDAARIDRMLMHYQTLIEAIVARPDQSIGTLPMLSDQEKQKLVHWNNQSHGDLMPNLDRLGGEELDALLNDLTRDGVTLDER
jgi:non-ribosomal peptide synthetase component F